MTEIFSFIKPRKKTFNCLKNFFAILAQKCVKGRHKMCHSTAQKDVLCATRRHKMSLFKDLLDFRKQQQHTIIIEPVEQKRVIKISTILRLKINFQKIIQKC
jgi:hypothetical protein